MTRRILCIIALVLATICIFTSCTCEHAWSERTCIEGSRCTKCGEEGGPAKGHSFIDATCTEPQKCSVCGTIGNGPLGHTPVTQSAISATCTTAGSTAGSKCEVCFKIISGCEEIPPLTHSTRLGICSKCDQFVTELLPKAHEILDKIGAVDDAMEEVGDDVNYALSLSPNRIPDALNAAFSSIAYSEDIVIDAYTIAMDYDEFSNLKDDINTLYGVVVYIRDLQANSSNYISVSYEYMYAAEIYWEAKQSLLLKMSEYIP